MRFYAFFGNHPASFNAFYLHFEEVQDPRQITKITYPLFDVLFLAVCAVIYGTSGWENIEDFGEMQLDCQRAHFLMVCLLMTPLPVFSLVWTPRSSGGALFGGHNRFLLAPRASSLPSTVRRSNGLTTERTGSQPFTLVSAFTTTNCIVMEQLKTEAKSNEINAIPALLKLLDIISIDAMGCQKEITETIIRQRGDYLLTVKGNQKNLYSAILRALADSVSALPSKHR